MAFDGEHHARRKLVRRLMAAPAVRLKPASRTISASGKYFFYPAATLVGTGTVGVSIGQSSGTTFGSLYTTAGTWGGTLAAPALVKAGNGDEHHHAVRRLQRRRPQVGHDQPVLGGR